jgi:hypothetical protein
MHPLFTQIIRPSVFAASASVAIAASASDTAASAFIMEENFDEESNNIPCSQRASTADVCLAEVKEYLQFLTCLQGLSNSDFRKFMQYSSGFFFSNGKLWQHNMHGKHKIVVLKEKRYELLKEVHDILGHKKIYAVRMQLLERFWPFLNQDVKWFVQTCHQCQVHQMRYHHIPLTVAREAIMKVDREERKWPTAMHAVFWAEQITTHKALGHSAYYIAHGVKPLLPFDLAEATYMVLPQSAMSTTKLIALRA